MKKVARGNVITVRLSDAELADLRVRAGGLTLSEYVRLRLRQIETGGSPLYPPSTYSSGSRAPDLNFHVVNDV